MGTNTQYSKSSTSKAGYTRTGGIPTDKPEQACLSGCDRFEQARVSRLPERVDQFSWVA